MDLYQWARKERRGAVAPNGGGRCLLMKTLGYREAPSDLFVIGGNFQRREITTQRMHFHCRGARSVHYQRLQHAIYKYYTSRKWLGVGDQMLDTTTMVEGI